MPIVAAARCSKIIDVETDQRSVATKLNSGLYPAAKKLTLFSKFIITFVFITTLTMCNCSPNCIYEVQFPGITPSTVIVSIGGLATPGGTTASTLVASNPMFYFEFGVNGQNTLVTNMSITPGVDLQAVTSSGTYTAIPLTRHPIHAPR